MENKITKEFLQTFINSLTKLCNNRLMFINAPNRQINVLYVKKDNDTITHARVEFFENNYIYKIYANDFDSRDENMYEIIYFEVIKNLFFSIDSVGILQNQKGERVDILTAQSLFNGKLTEISTTEN
jgi:hypothetical protein